MNRPLRNRLSPAKRTDIDARVAGQPCFPGREAGAVALCKPSTGNVARTLRPTAKAERRTEAQEDAQEDALLNVFYSAIAQLMCATLVFETLAWAIFSSHAKREQHGGPFWEALWPCLNAVDT